jgi:hypothetical protein
MFTAGSLVSAVRRGRFAGAWTGTLVFMSSCLVGAIIIHATFPLLAKRGEGGADRGEGSRDQIVLVFVGSTSCTASRSTGMKRNLARARRAVERHAAEEGATVFLIGAAESHSAAQGLAFLEEMGPFDEMAAGGGWANSTLLKYVVTDLRGPGTTPQLLVLRRSMSGGGWGVASESLVLRLVGLRAVEEWLRSGSQLSQGG